MRQWRWCLGPDLGVASFGLCRWEPGGTGLERLDLSPGRSAVAEHATADRGSCLRGTSGGDSVRYIFFCVRAGERKGKFGGGMPAVIWANSSFQFRWSWADAPPRFCTIIGYSFMNSTSRSPNVRDNFIRGVCEARSWRTSGPKYAAENCKMHSTK